MNADNPGDILSSAVVERRTYITILSTSDVAEPQQGWATWRYNPADPVAVSFQPDGSTPWTFARVLVAWGLRGEVPAAGSVRLWPSQWAAGRMFMQVRDGGRWAAFELPTPDVEIFLAETCRVVRPGTEFADVDWDMVVAGWSA